MRGIPLSEEDAMLLMRWALLRLDGSGFEEVLKSREVLLPYQIWRHFETTLLGPRKVLFWCWILSIAVGLRIASTLVVASVGAAYVKSSSS